MHKVLVVDNYDSFTFNLVQLIGALGYEPTVVRNDQIAMRDIHDMRPDRIVISPGPGTPDAAGISVDTVLEFGETTPVLGVCLGHQAIATAYGGGIVRVGTLVHGKTSEIIHDGRGVFVGIPSPLRAARYHSLVVRESDLPPSLEVTARSESGLPMGIRHRTHPVEGIQFHPESFMTEHGDRLLANFLDGNHR